MKISLNWLEEVLGCKIPASPNELSEKLFSLGFEVSSVTTYPKINGVVSAKVLEIDKHPNADKLRLAKVTDGKETQTVVCGAPNIEKGQVVFWAQVGAHLAEGLVIKKASIRGVESPGMICSLKELGVGDGHAGIWALPEKLPIGSQAQDLASLEDIVIDIEVTPNRPDALSVTGIAREIAAAYSLNKWSAPKYECEDHTSLPFYPVEVEDKSGCSRYIAKKINNIQISSSSPKIQVRLVRCGIRPINNVVDITNYVLLETGQPLHAFDADKLEGGKLLVRRARNGEKILALDGKTYDLAPDLLVIADAASPVAIAGIMGGEETSVTENTKNILLESAIFNRSLVRYGRNKLKLSSESSYRFERGVSLWNVEAGSDEAEFLFEKTAGGQIESLSNVQPNPDEKNPTRTIRYETIQGILGEKLPVSEIAQIFQKLGIFVLSSNDEGLKVQSPPWRLDLNIEADYVEEVARLRGYHKTPSHGKSAILPDSSGQTSRFFLLNRMRSVFSGLGFDEAINYGLVSQESASALFPADSLAELENPLASDQSVLRPAIAFELLINLKSNLSYQKKSVRLFEIGTVFKQDKGKILERSHVGAVAIGKNQDASWQEKKPAEINFYWIKGAAQEIVRRLGAEHSFAGINEVSETSVFFGISKLLHPVYSIAILGGKKEVLGVFGLVHPAQAKKLDLPNGTAILELDIFAAATFSKDELITKISLLPEIERDCSIWVKKEVSWESVRSQVESTLGSVLKGCRVFDVYTDDSKPAHKSLSFTLTFQYPDKTLNDDEANALRDKAVSSLEKKFSAELRSK